MAETIRLAASRREFLAGAGAFTLAVALPALRNKAMAQTASAAPYAPNAFIRITPDNIVTVLIKHIEFGQGTFTGLATLAAEELDADWALVRAEHSPANDKIYGNATFGGIQGTGGSSSVASSYEVMRKAGAAARAMFVAAAAKSWGAPAGEISVAKSVVAHGASGKKATLGELAALAAKESPPANPQLKSPDKFQLIGKTLPKLDSKAKSTGAAIYTLDLYRDGMLTAVVAHPSKFGAKVASFDDADARKIPGVRDVKKIGYGVAVYATNTYAALKGRKALKVTWSEEGAETRSTEEMIEASLASTRETGKVVEKRGDAVATLAKGGVTLDAEYAFPYLAHAPMEPLDAVFAPGADGGIDVWTGSQFPSTDKPAIAEVCGVPPEKINLNIMLSGGSFGRRAQWDCHIAREAAEAFMALGGKTPVKLMWTREDDIRGGYYRPIAAHRLQAALGADGKLAAWRHVAGGQAILLGTPVEALWAPGGIDPSMFEGASDLPYATANFEISVKPLKSPVPTLWWRSVGHTHTGYVVETFIDELLEKAGKDPIDGRLALMTDPKWARLAGVLKKARDMAGGLAAPAGRARGVAAVSSFSSYVAEIAEVSIENGEPRVHKVWCAVDCGVAVNPEIVKAQMESGIGYGLGAILYNEIELAAGGEIVNSNFHDYRSLRMGEMPDIEVAIMPSTAAPTGVGEPGTPPIGPAVANALRRLTGKPIRRLPIIRSLTS